MALRFLSQKTTTVLALKANTNATSAALLSTNSPSTSSEKNSVVEKKTKEYKLEKKRENLWEYVFAPFTSWQGKNKGERIPSNQVKLAHVVEGTTGRQKLLFLALEAGIPDPFDTWPMERGTKGLTEDDPIQIYSFEPERVVGCKCEPAQTYHQWQTLFKGYKTRCRCGYYMELIDAPRFWEKIPKEELLTIPFFRYLEEDGKLDKFLANELEEPEDHDHHEEVMQI